VDDCQYTLAYVYWTRPIDDESAASEEKQKSDIEKAKNNKEEEVYLVTRYVVLYSRIYQKYQYTSFRYISAVGMSSVPPRAMKGRRYFSSELPRDEESQDLPRPLRYGGQIVKLEEDDKNNKSNANNNANCTLTSNNNNNNTNAPLTNVPSSDRHSLNATTPINPTALAEVSTSHEESTPRSELAAVDIGGNVVFNDLFTCVATGTATVSNDITTVLVVPTHSVVAATEDHVGYQDLSR